MPIRQRYAGPASDADAYWMQRALDQAAKCRGTTSPNPPVGAVLVKNGLLLAVGHTQPAGQAHAEVVALNSAGDGAKHATLYVTLEPCSSYGRTPPCTEAIVRLGVSRVVYGATDPNLAHAGRAQALLEASGISVRTGVLKDACEQSLRFFCHWIQTGRPYIIAKAGLSLDGRLNRPNDEPSWLTSPESRRDAQQLRLEVDAILVGAETIRQDDPQLTLRHPHTPVNRRPLWRIILTRSGALPEDAKVFNDELAEHTLTFTDLSWDDLLIVLAEREITSVLIEGGGQVVTSALKARCVQEMHLYFAPMISGGTVSMVQEALPRAITLSKPAVRQIGDDLCVSGPLSYD